MTRKHLWIFSWIFLICLSAKGQQEEPCASSIDHASYVFNWKLTRSFERWGDKRLRSFESQETEILMSILNRNLEGTNFFETVENFRNLVSLSDEDSAHTRSSLRATKLNLIYDPGHNQSLLMDIDGSNLHPTVKRKFLEYLEHFQDNQKTDYLKLEAYLEERIPYHFHLSLELPLFNPVDEYLNFFLKAEADLEIDFATRKFKIRFKESTPKSSLTIEEYVQKRYPDCGSLDSTH